MNTYKRHRFPPDIVSYAVQLYYRFNLSHRDVEDLLAERGINVSRESIRLWCIKFGALYTRRLKRKHRGYGDTFYIDEVFVKINGKQRYLWRAVDQNAEVVDVFLQAKGDGAAVTTRLYRIYSIWVGTRLVPSITAISGQVRSLNGVGQWPDFKWWVFAVCES